MRLMLKTHSEGALVADGTEQTVTIVSEPCRFSGYLDLSNMENGDVVIIRQYVTLTDGSYKKYAEETYTGVQMSPVVYFTPKEITSSIKITLEQTAGTYKSFEYKFVKEVEPYKDIADYLDRTV